MLIVDDYVLHTLQRDVNNAVDVFKALVSDSFPFSLLKVEAQVSDAPLSSMLVVVVHIQLGDSHVSQMDKQVVPFVRVVRVLLHTEPTEAVDVQPGSQRPVTCNKDVYS